jgi:hypothetical protein
MTPQEIMDGLQAKNRLLTQKNEEYLKLSEKKAQCERDYSKAYANAIAKRKIEGDPTTIVKELAKGDVSDQAFDLAIADGVMKACLESIKDIREAIGSYRSLLTWLRAELTGNSD